MTWHYSATHRPVHGDDVFEVREVFPADEQLGETLWTEDAMAPYGNTKAELVQCLRMMLADVQEFGVFELDGRGQ